MIEKRYYLHRENLTYRIVYINPAKGYFYEITHAILGLCEEKRLAYYDIDPKTDNRTGGYYRASDLFRTEQECKDALRCQIKENIKKCRKEIRKLEKRCKELESLHAEKDMPAV